MRLRPVEGYMPGRPTINQSERPNRAQQCGDLLGKEHVEGKLEASYF